MLKLFSKGFMYKALWEVYMEFAAGSWSMSGSLFLSVTDSLSKLYKTDFCWLVLLEPSLIAVFCFHLKRVVYMDYVFSGLSACVFFLCCLPKAALTCVESVSLWVLFRAKYWIVNSMQSNVWEPLTRSTKLNHMTKQISECSYNQWWKYWNHWLK